MLIDAWRKKDLRKPSGCSPNKPITPLARLTHRNFQDELGWYSWVFWRNSHSERNSYLAI
jgi:hypothetical protein